MIGIFLDTHNETEDLLKGVERMRRKTALYFSDTDPEVKDSHLGAIANGLHGIYTGIEQMLKMLVLYFDGEIPQGKRRRHLLVNRACRENPGVRPALCSEHTGAILEELGSFRQHFLSHYHASLVPERVMELAWKVEVLVPRLIHELQVFEEAMERSIDHDDPRP